MNKGVTNLNKVISLLEVSLNYKSNHKKNNNSMGQKSKLTRVKINEEQKLKNLSV